jgi:hypothetical protein
MPAPDPERARLFARIGGRRPDRAGKRRAMHSLAEAALAALERLGGAEQGRLTRLWRNWRMVMGPDLADLAIPLGTRKRVLLVGGEDAMALQELSFHIPDMLERANAFMDAERFDKIELRLTPGLETRARLTGADVPSGFRPAPLPPRPADLGGLTDLLPPDSPIGRCYAAYLRLFSQSENAPGGSS